MYIVLIKLYKKNIH